MELDRFDWLSRRREGAVDAARPIIDPHHHLWDRGGSTYLVPQLLDDLTATHNVVKTVFVECRASYDKARAAHMQPVGETVFAAAEAAVADAAGGPRIAGLVGHADMMLGEAVAEVLAAHDAAGGGRFRGVRHATAWDASDEVRNGHSRPFEQMMGTGEFRAGVRTLAEMGFSFDAWLYHPQLPELAALAAAAPEATVVVNHLGGPLGIGPYRGDRSRVRADWRASVERLAACPNVFLKLGRDRDGRLLRHRLGGAGRSAGLRGGGRALGRRRAVLHRPVRPRPLHVRVELPGGPPDADLSGGVERLPDHGLRLHRCRAGRPVLRHRRPGVPAVRQAALTRSTAARRRLL